MLPCSFASGPLKLGFRPMEGGIAGCAPALRSGEVPLTGLSIPLLVRYRARSRLLALPPQATSSLKMAHSVSFSPPTASRITAGLKRCWATSITVGDDVEEELVGLVVNALSG